MPREREWLTYAKWSEKYGDLVYLSLLGQHFMIVDTYEVAHDLLNKRSAIYSTRPHLTMAGELVGLNLGLLSAPLSSRFNEIRKLLHKGYSQASIRDFWPVFEHDSQVMSMQLLSKDLDFADTIRQYVGTVIYKTTYGYSPQGRDDPKLRWVQKSMHVLSEVTRAGGIWLVDVIPFLRYLPQWLPLMGFKRQATAWRGIIMEGVVDDYKWATDHQNAPSTIKPNFISSVLSDGSSSVALSSYATDVISWAAASMVGGGSEATAGNLLSFILAMALFPDVQNRAREEIQGVVGKGIMPTLSDRKNLPFVDCIFREVLRWNGSGPLGFHMSRQSDRYRDYVIPKGTIMVTNMWSMLHNPVVFPEPLAFKPERFLNDEAACERFGSVIWGFGRRVCPGSHFAEASLFIAIATMLATCVFSDPVDPNGVPVPVDVEYESGIVSLPKLFTCKITPVA
ncbi:cytochrome P450 [Mycena pura]|uniref:Cytochrome P450 n=1 Tax=Mycena pura TaxID=153505 RepID=A0AAD6XZL0_9AGAR|nr:cytochrome P450 [Mycena pura]